MYGRQQISERCMENPFGNFEVAQKREVISKYCTNNDTSKSSYNSNSASNQGIQTTASYRIRKYLLVFLVAFGVGFLPAFLFGVILLWRR